MALPKQSRPEYSTTLPSTGKRVKYQPFSVREEKVLILAAEGQDPDEITNAISNVLSKCITSPADLRVEELALFDIEYLFLKARAKSAGEKITINVTDPDDETYTTEHEINIDKIGVHKEENHTDLIELNETTFVKMRYPDITFFNDGIRTDNITDTTELIGRCISSIIIDEETYSRVDMTNEELEEWMDDLTTEQFKKISEFFATMPRLKHSFTLKNKNTGNDFTIELEGLADFF